MFMSVLQTLVRPMFGSFEPEEFKKFVRMGVTFAFIICTYWTIRVLKNALFCTLVGAAWLPYAKTVSLLLLVPFVVLYTALLNKHSYKKTFYILSTFYMVGTLVFALLLLSPVGQATPQALCARTGLAFWGTQILGFAWYVFVESYGSLVIALFWAMAASTTMPESAKKGFALVYAMGQFGGILGPYFIGSLPLWLGLSTNALSLAICSITAAFSIYFLHHFFKKTPQNLLVSFTGTNEKAVEEKQEPGFFEGLKLLLSQKYLLAIFAMLACAEVIITIFDMHFNVLAAARMSGVHLASYTALYGSCVNSVTFLCLILGVSNITRLLGVGVALVLMPIIFALAITGFISFDSLNFLFSLMVCSKAINYALAGPAIKQLYIPTTPDVRFKAQAWIETFGSRGAKEAGAVFNMSLKPLQSKLGEALGRARHVMYSAYFGFAIVLMWLGVAIYLGRTHKKAVKENRVVC